MDEKQKFTVVSEVSKEKSGLIRKKKKQTNKPFHPFLKNRRRNIAPREYFFSRKDI